MIIHNNTLEEELLRAIKVCFSLTMEHDAIPPEMAQKLTTKILEAKERGENFIIIPEWSPPE